MVEVQGDAMSRDANRMIDGDSPASDAQRRTVAAGVARGLFDFAVVKGAPREMLARQAGIDPDRLADPDARVSFATYVALMRSAQALTGDPALALHFAEEVDLSEISVVGLITHACKTMGDAFAQLARYNRLVTEHDSPGDAGRFQRQPAGEHHHWLVDTRLNPNAFPEATEVALARLAVGPRVFDTTPFCREVRLTYPAPSYRSEYDRIFQAPVIFESDRNALLIDNSWSFHKIAPRQRYAFGVLSAHADSLMRSLDQAKSFRGRVEAALMPTLHKGEIGMTVVAAKLGISRRTLGRRLAEEDTTYEALLDGLRHQLALHYLEGSKVSVTETAYLVGFSDPAAFSRAFKRWTGFSPRDRPNPGAEH